MSKERAKLSLDTPESIDISLFKPKSPQRAGNTTTRTGDEVAAAHGFTPREPIISEPKNINASRKRNRPPPYDAHMSIRAYEADVRAFHALANETGWKSGKLLSELLKTYHARKK